MPGHPAAVGDARGAGPVPRIVLDSNVCLDLFVFADPRCAPLLRALQGGDIEAVTVAECRDEWVRVLGYPRLALPPAARAAALADFDALVRLLPESAPVADAPKLPRCKDQEDQKFLQLALDSGARWLLSRDAELLTLAGRTRRAGLFEILSPDHWQL